MWMLMLVGLITGMRTMTPMAVFCWFAYLGLLPQTGWSFWTAKLVTAIVFTVLALGEYVGDTLPQTPNRTAAGPLLARLGFASLVTAMAAHATQEPEAGGVVFGIIGALVGAFGGYHLRMWASRKVGRDLPVALTESALSLGLAITAAFVFHGYYLVQAAFS